MKKSIKQDLINIGLGITGIVLGTMVLQVTEYKTICVIGVGLASMGLGMSVGSIHTKYKKKSK